MALTLRPFLTVIVINYFLISGSWAYETSMNIRIEGKTYGQSDGLENRNLESKPKVRKRAVQAERTLQGSIYQGLRSDYLLTITLPWTLGMFAFVVLLLVCMRSDGWLYHLFTDDYVPPAVKKRLEEEARRAEGRRAKIERDENWNQVRKTWETEITEVTERVKSTMPPNTTPIQSLT